MKQGLRIFVSSPGDVTAAREIAALTIERLAQDYARFLSIEPYLWEFEAMVASGHFQDSIEPPSAFDVVVLILWSRLGTHLPERTAVREYRGLDGRVPVTGTEWEFEEAFHAAKQTGAPDLLVYRNLKPAPFDTQDPGRFEQQSNQLKALNAFWERHFANQGIFIGAYTSFTSDAEFAAALENHLRKLIEKRIAQLAAAQRSTTARAWVQPPFRGLESYEFEHAPIFFGQDAALAKAMLRLEANAEAGLPFLLVLGASGSGKSSLVKAGIVPKLFVPRRIAGTAFLRRVVFRPSDVRETEDLFGALARRLTTQLSGQEGVSELLGHGQSAASLAAHLRGAAANPAFPIGTALGQLSLRARQEGRMLEYESAKLVLVIDQLEELFTDERITSDERRRFVDLLAGLVRSGLVWVIATMRKDFWHRADEAPELVRLAEGNGRLELLPPSPSQLSQMIRRPAEAADISFEVHATTNVALNEVIAEEVAREVGALPLLSYLLDQLYRADVIQAEGATLGYTSYERLGKLEGAIATQAEAVLARCAPEEREAIGSVLFSLVQMDSADGDIERAIARRVPLSTFPPGTPQRRLVDRLLDPDARLLVSDAEKDSAPTVRVAHEALISRWAQARDFVQSNAEALKIRRRIEERYALWRVLEHEQHVKTSGPVAACRSAWHSWFGEEQGLLSDIDLADGQRLLSEHRPDSEPHLIAYIERSVTERNRIRTRTIRVLAVIAGVVALLAVVASGAGWIAFRKQHEAVVARDAAERRQKQAESLVTFMLGDLNDKLAQVQRLDIMDAVDNNAMRYFQSLPSTDITEEVLAQRVKALEKIGSVRLDQGHLAAAAESYGAASKLAATLADGAPADTSRQLAYAETLAFIGLTDWGQGRLDDAERQFESAQTVLQRARSAGQGANDPEVLFQLTVLTNNIGHVFEARGRLDDATGQYEQMLVLSQQLVHTDPNNAKWLEKLAAARNNLGKLALTRGDLARSVLDYKDDDTIESALSARDPKNNDQRERMMTVRAILGRTLALAGGTDAGTRDLQQAVELASQLKALDPGDSSVQEELGLYSAQLARARRLSGDLRAAMALTSQSSDIFSSLTRQDPTNAQWQREFAEVRVEQAAQALATGRAEAARTQARDALATLDPLLAQHPDDRAILLADTGAKLLLASVMPDADAARALRADALQSILAVKSGSADPRLLALRVEALLVLDQGAQAQPVIRQLWEAGYCEPALVSLLHGHGIDYPVNSAFAERLQQALAPERSIDAVTMTK